MMTEIFQDREDWIFIEDDIFNDEITDDEINEQFEACEQCDNKKFFFHTSNAHRYNLLDTSQESWQPSDKNLWFGQDMDTLMHFYEAFWLPNKFLNISLSVKPQLSRNMLWCIDWVILDPLKAEDLWIEQIVKQCNSDGVPVYVLGDRDYPKEFPKGLAK